MSRDSGFRGSTSGTHCVPAAKTLDETIDLFLVMLDFSLRHEKKTYAALVFSKISRVAPKNCE